MNKQIRKGAVDLTELAIGIIILGIAVSIGATILINVRDSQITNTATTQVANESVTGLATAGDTLAQRWVAGFGDVVNSTGGEVVPTSNYTTSISADGTGTITGTAGKYIGTNVNVTYTIYDITDPRYTVADNASIGLAEYGNWFKILVIVGIAAVVLALIFMAFGNRSQSVGVGY